MGRMTGANVFTNPGYEETPEVQMARVYDNRGRRVSETDTNSSSSNLVYSYSIPNPGGYDGAGNVKEVTDSVIGHWTYGYDQLNRLTSAASDSGPWATLNIAYSHDNWGNLLGEAFTGSPTESLSYPETQTFNGYSYIDGSLPAGAPIYNNHMEGTSYDASGGMQDDGTNSYLYDAEGRICAFQGDYTPFAKWQYIYDGMGHRVAKGTITTFSCDRSTNGYSEAEEYLVGQDGQQMIANDPSSGVEDIDVMDQPTGGQLLASDNFQVGDWYVSFHDLVGTRRAEADDGYGELSLGLLTLPYGESLNWAGYGGADATNKYFADKPLDVDSHLNNFGARDYKNFRGFFMTPDPSGLAFANLGNPQSLNLYAFALGNPVSLTDPTGLAVDDCIQAAPSSSPTMDRSRDLDTAGGPPCSVGKGKSKKDPCAGIPNCVSVSGNLPYLQQEEIRSQGRFELEAAANAPAPPQNQPTGPTARQYAACAAQGAAAGIAGFFGAPNGISIPPNPNALIRPARAGLEAATPALITTAGELGGTAAAEFAADFIPGVGEALLVAQTGVAIYRGVKQYSACINQH
jgi:RHS repeat-associated protein